MTVCELAAAQASWDRHCDQAIKVVGHRPPVRLTLAGGLPDDMRAPGPAHPASIALSKREPQ